MLISSSGAVVTPTSIDGPPQGAVTGTSLAGVSDFVFGAVNASFPVAHDPYKGFSGAWGGENAGRGRGKAGGLARFRARRQPLRRRALGPARVGCGVRGSL